MVSLAESWRVEAGGVDEVHGGHAEGEGEILEAVEKWGRKSGAIC